MLHTSFLHRCRASGTQARARPCLFCALQWTECVAATTTVQQLHRKLAPRPCHRCVLQYCFNSSIARAQSRCTKQCTYATSTGPWASSPFFRRPPISMAAHKRAHIKLETKFWQAHTRPTPRCGTSGSDCLGATDVIDNDAHGSRTHSSTA